jgi:hypothetical protein
MRNRTTLRKSERLQVPIDLGLRREIEPIASFDAGCLLGRRADQAREKEGAKSGPRTSCPSAAIVTKRA